MNDCLSCGKEVKDRNRVRYFVVPGYIMVPNSYLLCDEHQDRTYYFDDIYNEDGTRK